MTFFSIYKSLVDRSANHLNEEMATSLDIGRRPTPGESEANMHLDLRKKLKDTTVLLTTSSRWAAIFPLLEPYSRPIPKYRFDWRKPFGAFNDLLDPE
jgi:hypothetical protein